MAVTNFALRRYTAEIVYVGPGLGGKTTTLEALAARIPGTRLIREETEGERTVFFDLLPIQVPLGNGWTLHYNVKTLPGQVQYRRARQHNLADPDALVFVADSHPARADANLVAMDDLQRGLAANGRQLADIPVVLQYNKQDLPRLPSWTAMQRLLNPANWPAFGSIAPQGRGIIQPLGAAMEAAKARAIRAIGGGLGPAS